MNASGSGVPVIVWLTPEQWDQLAKNQPQFVAESLPSAAISPTTLNPTLPEGHPLSPLWWGSLVASLVVAAIIKLIVDALGVRIMSTLHRILITVAIFALDWIARNPEALEAFRAKLRRKAEALEAEKLARVLREIASPAIEIASTSDLQPPPHPDSV